MRFVSRLIRPAVLACLFAAPTLARAEMKEKDIPLLEAIAGMSVDDTRKAIADGANVNFVDGEFTPLNLAVSMSQGPIVDVLLASGADPTVRDEKGRTAIDVARAMKADAVASKLEAASKSKKAPAPANAPVAPVPVAAAPVAVPPTPVAQPAQSPSPAPPLASVHDAFKDAGETGTFDDVQFKTPDAKRWTSAVVANNLVFSAPLPPPDFCTITVYASRDVHGDAAAFAKAFDDLVQASLKDKKTKKIEEDSGPKVAGDESSAIKAFQRVVMCEAEDFHTAHLFVAMRSGDRMQLIAYQSSGLETFKGNMADANQFLNSLSITSSKTLSP